MAIKAVIFDFGGVLMRTEDQTPRMELSKRLDLEIKQLYDLIFDSPSANKATLGEITVDQHWENVRTGLGLTPQEFPEVRRLFWAGDRLDADLVGKIRSLRPRFKTALLSNAWSDLRRYLQDEWKIADAFDELIISAEAGIAKPAPEIFRLALSRLQVPPELAVFVDDFPANIAAARALGLNTVHFRSADQAEAELDLLLNGAN
jgi:epoxide hydrolase-like predicted phosphatase